jgi:dienelactone hydrolase
MFRSRRARWTVTAIAAFAAALLLALGGNSLGRYTGWTVPRLEPAALSAKLAPYYRVTRPDGPGPFPTALLFSGCDGPKDNLDRWAAMLRQVGWASIVVDSHSPRGFSDYEIWRLVCSGQLLMGSERAGDVLVAIDDARRMRFVDPERIVLIGASHGGWAIMDLFALDPPRRLPTNLASLPPGAPADPLAGVAGAILLYPYCGQANRARRAGWTRPLPTLFVLAEDDVIAPSGLCLAIAERLSAAGLPVEVVLFDGVTHGFDQQDRSALSPLVFDEAATAEAMAAARAFLAETAPAAPR